MRASSSGLQSSLLTLGCRWCLHRSWHCFRERPGKKATTAPHLLSPNCSILAISSASSCAVQARRRRRCKGRRKEEGAGVGQPPGSNGKQSRQQQQQLQHTTEMSQCRYICRYTANTHTNALLPWTFWWLPTVTLLLVVHACVCCAAWFGWLGVYGVCVCVCVGGVRCVWCDSFSATVEKSCRCV